MRISPADKYKMKSSAYVGMGCAYEDIYRKEFNVATPGELNVDGYISVGGLDTLISQYLSVKEKHYFDGRDRMPLILFLNQNTRKCCVYVYGHFLYADGHDYWSYYIDDKLEVVCVWYLD